MTRPSSPPDLLVVGGGIIGLACAASVAESRPDWRIEIVDASPVPSYEEGPLGAASWASAGMIAPLAEVAADRAFFSVCRASRDLWTTWGPALAAHTGVDLDQDQSGALILDEDGWSAELERAANTLGEPSRRIEPDAVRALVPDADSHAPPTLLLGAEHRVDNRAVCHALVQRLGDLGVTIRCATTVRSLASGSDRVEIQWNRSASSRSTPARRVLVTAGAWSGQIRGLPDLPIRPLRGQMVAYDGVAWPFAGCVRGRHFYAVRRVGNRLLVGATEEDAGFAPETTADGIAALRAWTAESFPGLCDREPVATWAGLRPTTTDGLPVIDRVADRVWIATGHHRNGILLTPWTAAVVSRWIADGVPPAEPAARLFTIARFAGPALPTIS